ncbi:transporter substrate-binding domain-containing protein [Humitalea sp. 24SJ18S-53]|uniref:transporter substrate-binding domain-containing protein n=1 Tax=Humitalea sp. 24SJ18S-53 TaxID=3422307 RepID=UPI003D67D2B9
MLKRRDLLLAGGGVLLSAPLLRPARAQDASTWAQIRTRGTLRIGVTAAEPWFYKDPASERWSGAATAYGEKLAEVLGVRMVPVETTWGNSIAAIQANQIDIMFVLDPTDQRRQAIDFPDSPLLYYALGAMTRGPAQVADWSELNRAGVRIGLSLGTTIDRFATENLPLATIERFASNDETVAAFAARRVDVVMQFHPALIAQKARLRMGTISLPKPVNAVPTSAGIRKEPDRQWKDWLTARFTEFYDNGTTRSLFEAYLRSRNIDPATTPGITRETWSL